MKHTYTKLLLAIVAAVFGVAYGYAEGPRSTSPADGETIFASDTSPLASIVITSPYKEPSDMAGVLDSGGNATLKKNGAVVQTLPPSQAHRGEGNSANQIIYTLLDGGVYEPGTYTFSVPANTLTYEESGSVKNLDAFEITFTILDANSMKVTPGDGSIVSRADLREIVISYSDKVKLQVVNPEGLKITQKLSNVDKDIFNYGMSVRGQNITLTCQNIDSPTNAIGSGSSYGNLVLTIPAGTYTIDGVPNQELTYSYMISAFTAKSITANPAPSDDSYTLAELRDISLEFSDEMQKGTVNLNTTVKLEQWVDGKWQNPVGFSSAVYFTIEWIDTYHARIYPRPVAGTYKNNIDDIETGRYAFHFPKNYIKSADNLANQDIYLGPYYIQGATEATILKQSPAANGTIRANDWEDIIFEFSSEMGPGDTDEKLVIKDASGNIVREFATTEVEWDGDLHSGRIHLDPPILRGTEEMVYTVEMPRGFMEQSSGSHLPSEAAKFNVTVGKNVAIEGNYPKYSVTPNPKEFTQMTGLGTFTFVYYGADSVELGDELPVFKTNGTSSGGNVTVTVGKSSDDFPAVIVTFANKVYSAVSGTKYTLEVPRLAWTISRGEHVYSTEENILYQFGGGAYTNVTSATVKTSVFSGTATIKYADSTDSEYTKENAVKTFSSVTINPGNSNKVSLGTDKATLKRASDNTVIATYDNPSSVTSLSTAIYTIPSSSPLTEDMFEAGETYYWELPTKAIQGYNSSSNLSSALKVYFTILSEAEAPQSYDIRVVNTAGKPRVRLDHIEFESDTDGSTYGFAIARNFNGGSLYIGDENGNRILKEGNEDDGGTTDKYSLRVASHKGNWISLDITPTVIEKGKYTIVAEEKAFSIDGVDYSKALVHPFEIKDNHVEWSIPIYEQVSKRDGVEGAEDHPMKGFNRITLTFPEDINVKVDPKKNSTFRRVWEETSGQDTYEREEVPESQMSMSAEGNEVYINFNPPLTEDGVYRLNIPTGAILMLGAFDEYVPVTSYKAYFRIQDSTTATVEPKNGSTVTELSDVTFNFTKAAEVLADTNPSAPAGLYDADMNELEGYKLSVSVDGNKAKISITPALDVDGDYTIIVPEGRFRCKATASSAEESATEYRLKYTVVDPSDPTASLAANSVVSSLDNIEFEFLKAVNVDLNAGANASIKDASGNVLSAYTVKLTQDKDYSDIMVFAAIEPAITTTGKYSFVLDADAAACQRTWDGDARNNDEYVIPFEVKNPTDSRVTPTSGNTLPQISTMTVTYANAAKVERGTGKITVLDADGVTPLSDYTASAEVSSDNTGVITVTPAITASGTYTIKIEAGTFLCSLSADGQAMPSRERTLKYTVKDPSEVIATAVRDADGNTEDLESIRRVNFTFGANINLKATETPEVTVVDKDGEDMLDDVTVTLQVDNKNNTASIRFEPAITDYEGEVTITVPEGTFSAQLVEDDQWIDVKEQVITCSLKLGFYTGEMNLSHESLDEIPTIIERLYVTFPAAEYIEIDYDVDDIILTHDTSVKVNEPEAEPEPAQARAMVTRAAEEETTYVVTPIKVDGEDNKIELSIDPKITAEGQATITIPEGKFIVDGKRTQGATKMFLVKGDKSTWVKNILGDESEVTVVSINGVVIMKDAPASELRTLEPGLYIINGKRVMISR